MRCLTGRVVGIGRWRTYIINRMTSMLSSRYAWVKGMLSPNWRNSRRTLSETQKSIVSIAVYEVKVKNFNIFVFSNWVFRTLTILKHNVIIIRCYVIVLLLAKLLIVLFILSIVVLFYCHYTMEIELLQIRQHDRFSSSFHSFPFG